MMYNILLIGAGQLGSRHLQGLLKCRLPVKIEVIEPSEKNRNTAIERAEQAKVSGNKTELIFSKSLDEISGREADLVIIATNSDVRAEIVTELTGRVKFRYLILEKVVYQSLEVFKQQISLLEKSNIKTWVNYPRRIYPFYSDLKKELSGCGKISLTVSGSNWGLGCNSLHFIDLLCFLTGSTEYKTDYVLLDPEILQSKRPGFVEFTGRLGFSNQGGSLQLVSYNHSEIPVLIEATTAKGRWLITEAQNNVVIYRQEDSYKPELRPQKFPFQSELTGIVAEDIFTTGECGLASLRESYAQHSLLLPVFNNHLFAIRGVKNDNCPIT